MLIIDILFIWSVSQSGAVDTTQRDLAKMVLALGGFALIDLTDRRCQHSLVHGHW